MLSHEVLIDNLKLRKTRIRGDELFASCPFSNRHLSGEDRHPSFSINLEKGVYNCFSCGSRGTLEELLSDVHGISIQHACEILEELGFDRLNRELSKQVVEEIPEIIPEGILYYFDKVDNDYIELYQGEEDGKDCLIYPVRDREGKLVGALARAKNEHWHKVMWNMNKKKYLYGENLVEKEKPLVIVEGPGDLLALKKAGVTNVVALMGVSLSDEQVEKLLDLSSLLIVWLDRDKAGAKGMNTFIYKMEKRASIYYVDPWKQLTEEVKDPKDVYEQLGADKVHEIINNAKTYIEYLIGY